jgi:peptidoglycan/xylan/chitin deacetylase (PgdA/CDA1 family)
MYHGISRTNYNPPVWTQLPEWIFREQLEYLKKYYNVLSMSQMIAILESNREFPERSAMVTFDDGLRNNYSIAYPILKEYSISATIFLTMDFIETERFFWFDELYFLVQQGVVQGYDFSKFGIIEKDFHENGDIWDVYLNHVERMKRMCEQEQKDIIEQLRREVKVNMNDFVEDFGMLKWDQIREMKESGLIDFGVHTATHRILSELTKSPALQYNRAGNSKL